MRSTADVQGVSELYVAGVDAVRDVTSRFDQAAWSERACGEWTAADTARHLVAVVEWYDDWLDRAIAGDASVPFGEDEFERRNRLGIDRHLDLDGPATIGRFSTSAEAYLSRVVAEWDRPFGYPGGTVTAGIHCAIAATEWHLHAWDLSSVRGVRHAPEYPGRLMVGAAEAVAHAQGGIRGRMIQMAAPMAAKRRPWQRLLEESGRDDSQERGPHGRDR